MKGLALKVCQDHSDNSGRGPLCGCWYAMNWNLWRQYCHCGAPATGYRVMGWDVDVEFFCDEHFQDVPVRR